MVYEDFEIVLLALRRERYRLEQSLDFTWYWAEQHPAKRLELARVNAEIAKRCWNRIRIEAAIANFRGG